jgi:hypothetical protein
MTTLHLNALTVALLVSLVLPALTSLVTKLSASVTVKQLVAIFFSVVTGAVSVATLADGTAVLSKETAIAAVLAFVTQAASYLGIFKPQGVAIAPTKGLG